MTDKEKDLNKESDVSGTNLKVEFKPSGEKPEPFAVKKTPTQIKIENNQTTPNSLDINSNLGSFDSANLDSTSSAASIPTVSTEKLSTLEKIQEKNDELPTETSKDIKIDFDKFERNKQVKVKTKIGIKLDG
jgi:hypothetical protein